MTSRVLVKATPPHTVHRLDCRWVAGTTHPPDRYREMDARDVQPGWRRCRHYAP